MSHYPSSGPILFFKNLQLKKKGRKYWRGGARELVGACKGAYGTDRVLGSNQMTLDFRVESTHSWKRGVETRMFGRFSL